MGAGVHGGFGNTEGYKNAIALSATVVNFKRINERLHIYSKNIAKENGYYDIIIHGKEDSFIFYHPDQNTNKRKGDLKGWADISHRTIAKYLKREPLISRLLQNSFCKKAELLGVP